ncbi:MAG: tetratricopeptide repeat protein [Proteobacteria bacterium]|nr:tetratricopeptide repeat protein [Pseudomonadota bacterium]
MNKIGRNDPCPCGSGKKYKQCCGSQEPAAAHAPSAQQIAQALGAALELHQQGRFAEAEPIYRQVLAVAPAHPDALHFCGVLAHQTGRHAEGAELIARSIERQPLDAMSHNNLGDALRALGRYDEALTSFRQALVLQPAFDEVHNNIGETLRAMGRLDAAADSFHAALSRKPEYAEAHSNLGLVHMAQGRLADAEAGFRQALALRPRYARAHLNLATLLRAQGRDAEAVSALEQALQAKPDYPEALQALADLFCAQGSLHLALACCQKVLRLQPDSDAGWRLYAEIIKLIGVEAVLVVRPPLLLAGLRRENIDPQNLERIAVAFICADADITPLLEIAALADGRTRIAKMLAAGELQAAMSHPLLLAVLEQAVVTDYRLERLLAALRQALLQHARAAAAPYTSVQQKFAAALALQCFANDYIYAITAQEQQDADVLAAKVAATLTAGQPCSPDCLAALACYQALYRLPAAGSIAVVGWSATMQTVIERQLIQPRQEETIRQTLPRLTAIDDQVSQAVRQQYEENPYPRWRRRGHAGKGQNVRTALQARFPLRRFDDAEHIVTPQILIAGCGTGSDAVQVANSFAAADILAVDMSLSSLSYAKRATQEYGIGGIDFRQADILGLAVLERQFDIVVSSGVLHHMGDPLAGWRVLTDLLRPGGYMNIGLYSRRARHEVNAARAAIQTGGYAATLQDIRRFRADVMDGRCAIDIGSLAQSPDFYSTSACRDLLFHVQEHVFSPLEIQTCIEQLGLELIGFEFSNPEALRRYHARFPDNPAADVLANWEILETEHAQIFAGMYQFWLRKKSR